MMIFILVLLTEFICFDVRHRDSRLSLNLLCLFDLGQALSVILLLGVYLFILDNREWKSLKLISGPRAKHIEGAGCLLVRNLWSGDLLVIWLSKYIPFLCQRVESSHVYLKRTLVWYLMILFSWFDVSFEAIILRIISLHLPVWFIYSL